MKPIKQSELLEATMLAMGIATPAEADLDVGRVRGNLPPLQILLAEDSLVNQKLAVALLETHGHAVTVASNGWEAISTLASRQFDVVLMDVQMPEMDGLAAVTAIRAREQARGGHVPIVAMTAHALKGDRELCLEAGMDEYVAKPIRAEQLFAAIEAVIPRSQAKPVRLSPPASGVDWSETLRSVQDNPILLASIVDAALEEIPRLMTTIEQAVEERDPTELRLAAHTLKGSLHYFGAAAAVQQASYLEQMGQTGDLHDAAEALQALDVAAQEVVRCLFEYVQSTAPLAPVDREKGGRVK